MPKGIYIRTPEMNRRNSESKRGRKRGPMSDENKRIQSEAHRGKTLPEEQKRKIAETLRGQKHTEERKRNQSKSHLGKKLSEEQKRKIREATIRYMKQHPNDLISMSATVFLDVLEKIFDTKFEREFELGGRFFDGKDGNLLVEVDSRYFHNTEKGRNADIIKNEIANNNGYTLVRFNINDMRDVHDFAEQYGITL